MTTFQAAGAGQAIEVCIYALSLSRVLTSGCDTLMQDAFVLSAVLGRSSVTLANVTTALTAYDDIRRPFSLDIQARSRQNGRWMTLHEGSLENFERNVMDNWNWGMSTVYFDVTLCSALLSFSGFLAWEMSPNSMLDQAISLLEGRLA